MEGEGKGARGRGKIERGARGFVVFGVADENLEDRVPRKRLSGL